MNEARAGSQKNKFSKIRIAVAFFIAVGLLRCRPKVGKKSGMPMGGVPFEGDSAGGGGVSALPVSVKLANIAAGIIS